MKPSTYSTRRNDRGGAPFESPVDPDHVAFARSNAMYSVASAAVDHTIRPMTNAALIEYRTHRMVYLERFVFSLAFARGDFDHRSPSTRRRSVRFTDATSSRDGLDVRRVADELEVHPDWMLVASVGPQSNAPRLDRINESLSTARATPG
jgi:hypothetical protein